MKILSNGFVIMSFLSEGDYPFMISISFKVGYRMQVAVMLGLLLDDRGQSTYHIADAPFFVVIGRLKLFAS